MPVDYNKFAKTFSQSRKSMNWPEIEYFFSTMEWTESILDIGCGSGRLLMQYERYFWKLPKEYLWIDLSEDLISEAKKTFPDQQFIQWDMQSLREIVWENKYESIFFIASLHHIENIKKRIDILSQASDIWDTWWKIYILNWYLHWEENLEKYLLSRREETQNSFGSYDYDIKIGEFSRYYHSFSLKELEYIIKKSAMNIEENRIFDTARNTLSICSC